MFQTSPTSAQRTAGARPSQVWVWVVLGGLSVAITAAVAVPTPMSAGDQSVDNIVLDFSATWCGPCQQMHPIVAKLEHEGLAIRQVDVDRNPDLARRFNVSSIPAFVLVVNGREVDRVVGKVSENTLRQMVAKLPAARTVTAVASPSDAGAVVQLAPAQPFPHAPKRGQVEVQPVGFGFPSNEPTSVAVREPAQPAARAQSPEVDVATGDPMQSTVRLRISDSAGLNYGTGTIIESLPQQTLILTCGHLFRQASEGQKVRVEVDLFSAGGNAQSFVGRVIGYDLEADVGLVSIPSPQPLPVASLAGPAVPLKKGESLTSIGCSGGAEPTREAVQSTALNKFQGPDNIECSGLPVQGRSGGGLFRESGELVGICILADEKSRHGIYAALKPVYALLKKHDLARLIPGSASESDEAPNAPGVDHQDVVADNDTAAQAAAATAMLAEALSQPSGQAQPAGVAAAALAQADDAEVVCIIRPKNPLQPVQIVIVNQASPKLLDYLRDDVAPDSVRSAKATTGAE